MRNLNERIQRNFRNNIAISNLREEWIMKKNTKKKVLITTMVIIGTLSGGFVTVNAASKGQLAEDIKNTVKVVFIRNNKEENIEGKSYINEKGENWIVYEKHTDNVDMKTDINKSELDKENMALDVTMTEDEKENSVESKVIIKNK